MRTVVELMVPNIIDPICVPVPVPIYVYPDAPPPVFPAVGAAPNGYAIRVALKTVKVFDVLTGPEV